MPKLRRDDYLAPEANVEFRATKDGGVVVDLASGTCFGLNRVAAEVWAALMAGNSLGHIIDSLGQHYPVDPKTLEEDTFRLCDQLTAAKLLRAPT